MAREELFEALEQMWDERDPVPEGLVTRMQALAAAELALADTDLDYELMLLIERTTELAGTRGGGTAYTLRFGGDSLDLLVRAGGGNGAPTTRIDGWIVPPAPASVRATRIGSDGGEAHPLELETSVDERGRFEFPELPRGLYRLWISPQSEDAKPFGTPAFEI